MKNVRIGIIGLGYVGLPLACLFSSKYPVIGYDINTERINDLRGGNDYTLEVKQEALKAILIEGTNEGKGLYPSNNLEDLHECNIYIITVPTPIDKMKRPNLRPLFQASKAIGKFLCKDDIVIYESTVYPGVTEEMKTGVLIDRFAIVHVAIGFFLPIISTLLVLMFDIDREGHLENVDELGYVEKS